MSNPSHYLSPQDRPRWQWWVIFVAVVVALPLGTYGFHRYGVDHGEEISWLSGLYYTGQLFVLHTAHLDKEVNWALETARWIAAAAFAAAAVSALMEVFGIELRRLFLRFRSGHIVICGAGWRGMPLAREYCCPPSTTDRPALRRREVVVVIEKDPHCEGLRECLQLGIPYFVADATNPKVLKAAGVHKARILVAACTEDGANFEIAVHARQLVDTCRRHREPLQCYVHIGNIDLRTMARQKKLIADDGSGIRVSTIGIDPYENSARLLFQQHALDWKPITEESPRSVHLVIFGFGQMGESVLIQAARIGHFANGKRLRVTVVDQSTAREAGFHTRYPQLKVVCDVKFVCLQSEDSSVVALAKEACKEENSVVTFVVCFPEDTANLALALKLGDALSDCRSPIRVRLSSQTGLALLLSDERQRELFGDQIRPFGMREEACNVEALERRELDALAKAVHEVYFEEQLRKVEEAKLKGESIKPDPARVPWEDLPEEFKQSNRHAADHIEIKLHAVGCHAVRQPEKAEPLNEFPPPQVEVLARMEHARYCAERFLAGWRYDPKPKDLVHKTNPTLVPWEKPLPEDEREKDREQVGKIHHILKKSGWYVCR